MQLQHHQPVRRSRWLCAWLAAPLLALLLLGGGQLAAADTLTPAALTIAGVTGEVVTRTVTVRLPSDAVNVAFVAQDLATSDGIGTLPAAAIAATLPPTTTVAGMAAALPTTHTVTVLAPMTVVVDLTGVASGSYTGQALLTYRTPGADGDLPLHEAPLGLTVAVKQPWQAPLALLVVGLGLGGGLSWYRSHGRPRDELLTMLGASRNRVEADPELADDARGREFSALANAEMEAALAALRQGAQQTAQQHADRAILILDLWQQQRSDWLGVLDRQAQLLKVIPAGHQAALVLNVRRAIELAPRTELVAALDDELQQKDWRHYVNLLQDRLDKLRIFKLEYDTLERRINAASNALAQPQVTAGVRTAGQTQLITALATLNALNPVSDEAGYRSKYTELTAAVAAVEQTIPPAVADGKRVLTQGQTPETGAAELQVSFFDLPMSSAELGRSPWPRVRLWLFLAVSFVLGWVLLAGAGFNELYVQKATFGANWLADYLALFAWGFGAEASRDAITTLVRGWGVPARE